MRKDDDFTSEIEVHIALEAERLVADGLTPVEARTVALRKFGNVTAARERFHESRRVMWLDDLRKDIGYALRTLRRNPGFAAVAILTLALGVGANTAIFGVVYQTLLKPLPFSESEQLVTVSTHIPQFAARFPSLPVSAQDFLFYRRSTTTFQELSGLKAGDLNLTGLGEPERLHGARVSANFFSMLGVRPLLGRDFLPGEDNEGQDDVVLISHALWQRRFGGAPTVLNRTISLDGRPHTVIGVMPADLLFPTGRQLDPLITFGPRIDLWKPIAFTQAELGQEGNYEYAVIGRLKPGMTLEAARQDMDRAARNNLERMRAQAPGVDIDLVPILTPLHQVFTGDVRRSLIVLEGAVGLLLLIACVNLANLLLVRVSGRAREFSTRSALGAPKGRLVRQVLTESLVVTGAGGIVGLALALWGGRLLMIYGPQTAVSRPWTLEFPVMAFAAGAALLTGLLFGAVPALHVTRRAAVGWLTNAARAVSDPGADRIRRVLVGFEVALCTALLAVAGLLLHSFVNVLGVDAGFAVERVLAIDLSLPRRQYANPQTAAFYRELIERVRAQPGVAAAGAVSLLPIAHEGVIGPVLLESDTRHRLDRPAALRRSVTPDLFSAMDIPLLAGRVFHDQEPALAVIASESLATRLWPGEPLHAVVGRGVRTDPANPLMTVVGVVGDIRADALDRAAPTVMYQHYRQDVRRGMTLVVRTARDPLTLAAAVRAQVSALDPSLPIVAIRTMAEIVDASVAERRFQMTLVVLFALLALGLAVVGIYGVTSYSVARRTQEIGLRVALGAGRAEVLRSVLADGLKPVAIGAALGMAAGQFGAMSIRSVLFGIGTLDPIALLGVTSLLVVTAALACFLPARAAAALDPVRALRSD